MYCAGIACTLGASSTPLTSVPPRQSPTMDDVAPQQPTGLACDHRQDDDERQIEIALTGCRRAGCKNHAADHRHARPPMQ